VATTEAHLTNIQKSCANFQKALDLMAKAVDEMSISALKMANSETTRREPNVPLENVLRRFSSSADAAQAALASQYLL
tara:strand:+ start:151 stop:384 length:234 start_codon:yes stop_codon:yes gene_type:complete